MSLYQRFGTSVEASFLQNPNDNCRLKRVPEASVWPFIGDTKMLAGDGEKLVKERYAQYGSVFSTWILGKRTIFIGSLDLMKWLLNKEHDIVEGMSLIQSCSFPD